MQIKESFQGKILIIGTLRGIKLFGISKIEGKHDLGVLFKVITLVNCHKDVTENRTEVISG